MEKIGLGGSCHWCTEAIFQSLIGVLKVDQGWIASIGKNHEFSEAVLVEFDEQIIALENLIEIHLSTHSCTTAHSLRSKYRSAIYTTNHKQINYCQQILEKFKVNFSKPIITEVIPLETFKLNKEAYLNYYYSNPQKPFCEKIVNPKLQILLNQFSGYVDRLKLKT